MSTRPHGVGIGLRRPHYDALCATSRRIDWLEFTPENYMGSGGLAEQILHTCAERWPLAAHGVSISLGGPDPIDGDYLDHLQPLMKRVGADEFSEHLCYASAHGVHYHDLLPLPFTEEAVQHVAGRIREVQDRLGQRMLVENISYYAPMPGCRMTEAEFIRCVLDEADCGLLLDVNNVYVNAFNFGEDPLEALMALPLERAEQIHMAGHRDDGDMLVDHHGASVIDPVWALYEAALARTGPIAVVIERDTHIPPLDDILDEADHAREILHRIYPEEADG